MTKVLIVDDNDLFLDSLRQHIESGYPSLQVLTCNDPIKSLSMISSDLDLLLVDLEMPGMDGGKILNYAVEKGVQKGRIIILSARNADYLHKKFAMGECLAVMNKNEAKQKEVFNMILGALQKKAARP